MNIATPQPPPPPPLKRVNLIKLYSKESLHGNSNSKQIAVQHLDVSSRIFFLSCACVYQDVYFSYIVHFCYNRCVWQAIEANKLNWNALFESFAFFEAYRNYLQIDIAAEADDDLMNWKGWVESRIRLLTLKVLYYI